MDDLSSADPGHDDRYADTDLQRALTRLPDKERLAVILRYFEDMPIDEIATVLNQNLSTTKSRLYKGLERLKTELTTELSGAAGGHTHG
jgi:RNA polymerase sigma-70 factor (ECF subfamily)